MKEGGKSYVVDASRQVSGPTSTRAWPRFHNRVGSRAFSIYTINIAHSIKNQHASDAAHARLREAGIGLSRRPKPASTNIHLHLLHPSASASASHHTLPDTLPPPERERAHVPARPHLPLAPHGA